MAQRHTHARAGRRSGPCSCRTSISVSSHARTRELNEFLHGVDAECIVLVGDIVDALSLARRAFWSAEHTQVLRTLLARQRAGARLVYIPGNHDASLAMLAEMLQGQLEVHREWVHRTAAASGCWSCTATSSTAPCPARHGSRDLGDVMYDAHRAC